MIMAFNLIHHHFNLDPSLFLIHHKVLPEDTSLDFTSQVVPEIFTIPFLVIE